MVFWALQLNLFTYPGYFQTGPAEGQDGMRLKLLVVASLLAAILGAGASIGIVGATLGSFNHVAAAGQWQRGWSLALVIHAPSFLIAFLASMFVYRHTARRRKLQGALTFILALLVTLGLQIAWLLIPGF